MRSRLVSSRAQLPNQIRGLLTEYGIVLPQHVNQLRRGLPLILEDATNELTALSRRVYASLYNELLSLEEKIKTIDEQFWAVYQASEPCQRIAAVEGIDPLIATALAAAMSDGRTFRNGRQFATCLGLVADSIRVAGKRACSAPASLATGLRVYKELIPMKKDQLDLQNATVWIPDSKAPNGVAEVPLFNLKASAFPLEVSGGRVHFTLLSPSAVEPRKNLLPARLSSSTDPDSP